ncbi:MAG: Major outer membrane porin [Chlamydiales bacterium]|nr:Major outer membrane porin [Chlamydiales bacterium]MCH9622560.1 Major outer membrane porin [Chlamydiales bacterium]
MLFCSSLIGLPLGNPSDASLYCEGVFCDEFILNPSRYCQPIASVRTGFYGNYVFDRKMELDSRDHGDLHQTKLYTNAGLLTVNFCNRVDVFAAFGASKITLSGSGKTFLDSGGVNLISTVITESDISYNAGVRGTIWECGCCIIGGEVQYFYTNPTMNRIQNESVAPFYFENGEQLQYQEWQVGLGVTYDIALPACFRVLPYAGIKWSNAWIDMGDALFSPDEGATTSQLLDFRNSLNWGYSLGLTFVGGEKWSTTVEGSFADELAFSFNTQFRF